MRLTLGLCFLLAGCGSDKFSGGDGGGDGSTEAGSVCAQQHQLCDDFDTPGEIAGGAPWAARNGPLSIVPNGFSKPSCLQAPATLSTFVTWPLPKVGGLTCSAMVSLDDAMARGRTLFVLDVQIVGDGGTDMGTTYAVAIDDQRVSGYSNKKGTLQFDNWAQTTVVPPVGTWVPFKFDVTFGATNFTISATLGPAMLSGAPPSAGKILAVRVSFGAANLDNMHMDIVRWDDIVCDSR